MDPVERLLAIEEIKLLKARYFRYVDTKNWTAFRRLFSEDAELTFVTSRPEPYRLEEAMAWIRSSLTDAVSVHQGFMPEIEIIAPDQANGVWAMEDRIFHADSRAAVTGIAKTYGWGHYHETYVRKADGWRIRTLRLTRLRRVTESAPVAMD